MPIFLAVGGAIAAFIAKFFTEYMIKRLAIIAAMVSVLALMVAGFYVTLNVSIGAISAQAPPGLSQAASLVVPDNVPMLVSALVTARIARWSYEWNVKVLQWRL